MVAAFVSRPTAITPSAGTQLVAAECGSDGRAPRSACAGHGRRGRLQLRYLGHTCTRMIGDETNHTQSRVAAVSPDSRLQSGHVDKGWADEAAPAAPIQLPARPVSRMRDIAAAAAAAPSTVSRLLNSAPSIVPIAESTRERELAAAARLGFRPKQPLRAQAREERVPGIGMEFAAGVPSAGTAGVCRGGSSEPATR